MCTGPRAVPREGPGGPEPALSQLEGLGANAEEAAQRKTDRCRQEVGALPVPKPRQWLVCVLCWFSGVPCSSIEAFVSSLGKSRAFPQPALVGGVGGGAWESMWTWSWVRPAGHRGLGPATLLLQPQAEDKGLPLHSDATPHQGPSREGSSAHTISAA